MHSDAIWVFPQGTHLRSPTAQRLMCWSQSDKRIRTITAPEFGFAVPGGVCLAGYGDLRFKPGGTVVPCNPAADEPRQVRLSDADVEGIDPATCQDPGPGPTLDAAVTQHDPGDAWTARVTVTVKTPGKQVQVDWGEGDPTPIETDIATHTYSFDDEYHVVVSYVDQSEKKDFFVTVPF